MIWPNYEACEWLAGKFKLHAGCWPASCISYKTDVCTTCFISTVNHYELTYLMHQTRIGQGNIRMISHILNWYTSNLYHAGSELSTSILWPQMTQSRTSPSHQQQMYWQCKKARTFASLKKAFYYLYHFISSGWMLWNTMYIILLYHAKGAYG